MSDAGSRLARRAVRGRRGARAGAATWTRRWRVIVEAGASAAGAPMAAVFAQDPRRQRPRAAAHARASPTTGSPAFEADVTSNPDHPIHHAALDRTGSLGRAGPRRRRLADDRRGPAARRRRQRRRRGVRRRADVRLGRASTRSTRPRRRCWSRIADLAAAAIATFRTSSMADGAGRVARARGAHRPADRARERPDARPGPRAGGRPRPAPGHRGLGRAVRRRRLPQLNEAAGARAGDQVAAPGRERCSPRASGWSTRWRGPAATSSCSSRRGRPA